MSDAIKRLTIEGYNSIRELKDFELRPMNILIGVNGAGKSNFVGFFRLLRELIEQRLPVALQTRPARARRRCGPISEGVRGCHGGRFGQ